MVKLLLCLSLLSLYPSPNLADSYSSGEEKNADFWKMKGQKFLRKKLRAFPNLNLAKNVIFFLGDGMSIQTISAARAYFGAEEHQHAFDKFPYTGLSQTYCVDKQTPDSACTATAYLCGVKANLATLGVTAAVPRGNCEEMLKPSNQVHSLAKYFQDQGRATGLITTTRVTDASPGALYAHIAEREWESDTAIINSGNDPSICKDISYQLIHSKVGQKMKVILGGGLKNFLPLHLNGTRTRGNLIEDWKMLKGPSGKFVRTKEEFDQVQDCEYLLGLFSSGDMQYNLDRNPDLEPSLEEMTEKAIELLKNDKGFFLFVEGAKIDIAHHDNLAKKALDETLEFSKAVQKALDLTDESDTLIVVTSDHAHTMSYGGDYPDRRSNPLGLVGRAADGYGYTILNYANGPGYKKNYSNGSRYDVYYDDLYNKEYKMPALAPLAQETHGADDVAVFAKGPWQHLFTGVMEQNVIPHLVAHAAGISMVSPYHV